jgi:hypothetical protein
MNLFFRENASSFEKIYTIFILVWMCLSIFGLRHNFKTAHGFSFGVMLVSALCSLLLLVPIYLDRHPKNKLKNLSGFDRVKAWGAIILLYFSFSWASIGLGMPAIYTSLWGEVVSEKVVVLELDGSRKKGCDPRVQVSDHRGTYCIKKSIFETLNEGDELYIHGRKSRLGFDAQRFSKLYKYH